MIQTEKSSETKGKIGKLVDKMRKSGCAVFRVRAIEERSAAVRSVPKSEVPVMK